MGTEGFCCAASLVAPILVVSCIIVRRFNGQRKVDASQKVVISAKRSGPAAASETQLLFGSKLRGPESSAEGDGTPSPPAPPSTHFVQDPPAATPPLQTRATVTPQQRMTEHEAFMQAICERPNDDAPRLMYADLLEERGDPRGEFIRVQLELRSLEVEWRLDPRRKAWRKHKPIPLTSQDEEIIARGKALRQRERELLASYWRQWSPKLLGGQDVCSNLGGRGDSPFVTFRRGFVEAVSCSLADWLAHGPALVRAAPLLETRLNDRGPYKKWQEGGVEVWRWCSWPDFDCPDPDDVPYLLWTLLDDCNLSSSGSTLRWKWYKTADLAHRDLSRACILWARSTEPS
jgi:uncharacterized protein (TIGR02996 family)